MRSPSIVFPVKCSTNRTNHQAATHQTIDVSLNIRTSTIFKKQDEDDKFEGIAFHRKGKYFFLSVSSSLALPEFVLFIRRSFPVRA